MSIWHILGFPAARDLRRRTVCAAIRQLRKIEFFYRGGSRTAEPYCLGITLKGEADNESLICYQTAGFSELGAVPGWQLYRASEMDDIRVLNDQFDGDRPEFDLDYLEMARIFCYVRPAEKPCTALTRPVAAPVTASLTHNELMARFRYAHPLPIKALRTKVWPEPLVRPFPERPESKIKPPAPFPAVTLYPVGQAA
ncbi:MAG: hypothetical protein WC370_10975 [Dehalococcoidales bacterium]